MLNLSITDENIDSVEKMMGDDIHFDQNRRAIIKDLEPVDVQAFPGAGKTTVVVAKLAALLMNWKDTNRGVCILSHTNVAKEEIQQRLKKSQIGKIADSYPHFIGTVHSFLDTFVSMPWLRANDYKITEIDSDNVMAKRYNSLDYGTKKYLENSRQNERSCETTGFPIVEPKIRCNEGTKSFQKIAQCIEQSMRNGFFTFDEMLLVAKHALKNSPSLAKAIQRRFPIVIIDESQDTSDLQWELINTIFPKEGASVLQLFGDDNQAIYGSNDSTGNINNRPDLPKKTIADSKRFGKKIATIANTLSLSGQPICGASEKYDKASNTIILFDRQSIDSVVPKFLELVMTAFGKEGILKEKKYGIHVVGMVHQNKDVSEQDDNKFPENIKAYWSHYNSEFVTKKRHYLIDYFRESAIVESFSDKTQLICSGIIRLINLFSDLRISQCNNSNLNSLLKNIEHDYQIEFKRELLKIVNWPFRDNGSWDSCVTSIKDFVKKWFSISLVDNPFLKWTDSQSVNAGSNVLSTKMADDFTIDVEFGSIHSVKGKTHLATLVVETFYYERNIKSILPWLTRSPNGLNKSPRNLKRIKCHFVALTRAKGMVCMAIRKDDLSSEDLERLRLIGWDIVDLC